MGIFFQLGKSPNWLALTSLVGYIVGFGLAMGPVPWLVMGEIFPANIRGLAASGATLLNWVLAFLITQFFTQVRYPTYSAVLLS